MKRFSREDLLRSFDVIARAESDLRTAAEPRYHLEMALLRWMHLRKLAPLADLIEQLQQSGSLPPAGRPAAGGPGGAGGGASPVRRSFPERPSAPPVSRPPIRPASAPVSSAPLRSSSCAARGVRQLAFVAIPAAASGCRAPGAVRAAGPGVRGRQRRGVRGAVRGAAVETRPAPARPAPAAPVSRAPAAPARAASSSGSLDGVKDAFIEEVRRTKVAFYRMTLSLAHRVEVDGERIVFSFAPSNKLFKEQVESNRAWLEPLAARVAGRRMTVTATLSEPLAAAGSGGPRPSAESVAGRREAGGVRRAQVGGRRRPGDADAARADAARDHGREADGAGFLQERA